MLLDFQSPYYQRLRFLIIIKRVCRVSVFNWALLPIALLAVFAVPARSWGPSLNIIQQSGKSFTVNAPGDEEDPNAGEFNDDGVCDVDPDTPGNQCTFRAAIQNHNANRHLDLNTISFDIDTEGLGLARVIIKVGETGLGPLPPILGAVNIQGLNSGSPAGAESRIELDGSMAGDNSIGLRLLGGNCHITFFVIHSFSSHGIFIGGTPPPGEGGHRLEVNYIGTDVTATLDKGNGGDGIFIEDTPDNIIGGAGILRNIISGNEGYGIHILGRDDGARNNRIEGNFVGLDFFEQDILPNTRGGILIEDGREITVGSTEENRGNKIAGVKNGVTIQGSLSEGIRVIGNFIGKEGTGSKFTVGILHRGKLITIEGNVLANIDSVGIDAFLNADGIYNIKENRFEGKMKVGTKLTFGEGRTIKIEYLNNFHHENDKGVEFEESVTGDINWNVVGNFASLGTTGGSLVIRANGTKNFDKNTWQLNTQAGFRYVAEIEDDVFASVKVTGEIYDRNGLEGVGITATVKGDLAYAFLNTTSRNNGKDGTRLEVFGEVGGQFTLEANESKAELNGGAGFRIINGSTRIDLLRAHFEKDIIDGNLDGGLWLFDGLLKFSVRDNVITNNGPFGIQLVGGTLATVAGNTISGHEIGVNVTDQAEVEMTSNTISNNSVAGVLSRDQGVAIMNSNTLTANGTALAVVSAGNGSSVLGNSIFGNQGLGIDLGNDGVTPNDPGDTDAGPNSLQNFPVLSHVSSDGINTNIQGSLNSMPDALFRLEFFSNTNCNPSGFGEGQTFLGFGQVITNSEGNAEFSTTLNNITIPAGSFVTATATDSSNNTSEFSACLLFGDEQLADLELTKSTDQVTATPGEPLSFVIKLINRGPDDATGIAVRDVAPAGLTFEGVMPSQGSYDASTGIWTAGALGVGDSAMLTIIATALQEGTFINTAEVIASDQGDPDSSPNNGNQNEDDQSSVSVEVQAEQLADLELTKKADRITVLVGEQLTYVIRLINKGPDEATGIAVRDVAPTGLTFESVMPSQGSYDAGTGIWTAGVLGVGDSATLSIMATAQQEGTFINTAEVIASDQDDPDSSPNNAVETEDDHGSIAVNVLETASIEEQLQLMLQQVELLVEEGLLSQREGRFLTALVNMTLRLYRKGSPNSAIGPLVGFNNFVGMLMKKGTLPATEGEALILAAERIIEQLRMEQMSPKTDREGKASSHGDEEPPVNVKVISVYPNPVKASAEIAFELIHQSHVQIQIFHEAGMRPVHAFSQLMPPGLHTVRWDPKHLPAGMYLLHIKTGASSEVRRLLVTE